MSNMKLPIELEKEFANDLRENYKEILSEEVIEKSIRYWRDKLSTIYTAGFTAGVEEALRK